jgi:hypothetical protein
MGDVGSGPCACQNNGQTQGVAPTVGHTRARLTPWPVAPMLKPETFQRNKNSDEFLGQFRNSA